MPLDLLKREVQVLWELLTLVEDGEEFRNLFFVASDILRQREQLERRSHSSSTMRRSTSRRKKKK